MQVLIEYEYMYYYNKIAFLTHRYTLTIPWMWYLKKQIALLAPPPAPAPNTISQRTVIFLGTLSVISLGTTEFVFAVQVQAT